MSETSTHFDFIIIGSGFGGSVSALRLSQKGYRVLVLEAGKRWRSADFAKSNWDARRYLWAPLLKCFGIQKISFLKGVMVLHGVGVGGGSLVYANTLLEPHASFFNDAAWPRGIAWAQELAEPYKIARRMLGVTQNQILGEADFALQRLALKLGAGDSFKPTDVGVFFGEAGKKVPDPYFAGEGPERSGCIACGGCMVGCRHGAKNTLDLNYLYFAEKFGAQVLPETRATRIEPRSGGGYTVHTRSSTAWFFGHRQNFSADRVILAAGVLGTLDLLLRNRDAYGTLPKISKALGEQVRTNGESLLAVTTFKSELDMSKGVAIGSAIAPDALTHIEPVRYPHGSSFMRLLGVPLTGPGGRFLRVLKMIAAGIVRLPRILRLWLVRDWARSTIILLVMQTLDRKMRLRLGSSLFGGLKGEAVGEPVPSYIDIAQKSARLLAQDINGEPQNIIAEVAFGTPATAHILGGCCMGNDPQSGVIDHKHEVFGHPGLYVCDGSVIPANLGVNPSLTITALSERFAAHFPAHAKADAAGVAARQIQFSAKPA